MELGKGVRMQQQGEGANHYWFLESGFVRGYVVRADGTEATTDLFSPGMIVIDWGAFMLRLPATEYLETLTRVVCWQISFTDFQDLFHRLPRFREEGRRRFAESYQALKLRHISFKSEGAAQRYETLIKAQPELFQHVPLQYIAGYLGITKSSLSRLRADIGRLQQ